MYYKLCDGIEPADYFSVSASVVDNEIAQDAPFANAGTFTTTGILLSTLWNQSGTVSVPGNGDIRYNEYCPTDPSDGKKCITGCTNTAAAQLIYYFLEQGALDFQLELSDSDAYSSGGISIKADGTTPGTLSFAAINEKLRNFSLTSADSIAALNYACGVVQKAKYGSSATSTGWNKNLFIRSGFESAINCYLSTSTTYTWGADTISDAGFEVLIENLQAGRPVGTSYPGHALVIDGYDAENDLFHINFGWGSSSATRWYTRTEIREKPYYQFVYDLCTGKEFNFTVNDTDEYGTGTLLRAAERASNTDGRNAIDFASGLAGKTVALHQSARFNKDVLIRNFNVVLTGVKGVSTPSYLLYGSGGVMEISDFSGSLINTAGSNGICSYNTSTFLDFSGAKIIANPNTGKTAAQLQTALSTAAANKSRVDSTLVNSCGKLFYLSNGADKVNLSNRTVAIGECYFYNGDDSLRVDGNSQLYGYLSFGEGTDTLVVDNSSYISISGISSLENVNFVLNSAAATSAIISIANSMNLAATNISVDISKAAAGTYTLIETVSNSSYLSNLSISILGISGVLSAAGTASNSYATVTSSGNTLKLTVKKKGGADVTAPDTPFGLYHEVVSSGVTLNWDDSYDNGGVKGYQVRYGKNSNLTSSATVTGTTSYRLGTVSSTDYSYQVRAYDSAGNYSDWSDVQTFGSSGEDLGLNAADNVKIIFGTGIVAQGKTLSGQTVDSGHRMNIIAGGTATGTTVNSAGVMYISAGGKAVSTTINNSATAQVFAGAAMSAVTVNSGGYIRLNSGATATNMNVSGGRAVISGTALNVQVGDRGYLFASNGGVCSSLVVNSGGRAYLQGSTGAVTVSRGGMLIVTANCSASGNITVAGNVKLDSLFKGSINMKGKTLTFDLSARSTADDFMIDQFCLVKNAALCITVGANQASGTYLLADEASSKINSATIKIGSSSYTLTAGNTLKVGSNYYTMHNRNQELTLTVNTYGGGTAASVPAYRTGMWSNDWVQASTYAAANKLPIVAVYGDKEQCGFCATMDSLLLESPQFKAMSSSMVTTYDVNPAYGSGGGYPSIYILNADGSILSSRHGFGSSSFADYYQWLQIHLGKCSGIFSSSTVNSNYSSCSIAGGVSSGAGVFAVNATVSGKSIYTSGKLHIGNGGKAVGNVVSQGGSMIVTNCGTATSTTISSGGRVMVKYGGTASNTTVTSIGNLVVSNGGSANYATVSSRGGVSVCEGGKVTNLNMADGGRLYIYLASGTTVSGTSDGKSIRVNNGTLSGNTISTSCSVVVNSGGKAINNDINDAVSLIVSSGGSAGGNRITDCYMMVYAGALVNNTIMDSDGDLYVYSGAVASNTKINSDGDTYVYSGGLARGVNVSSGGRLVISSGGNATSVNWTPCVGRVTIADGGQVTFTSKHSGVYWGSGEELRSQATAMNNSTFSGSMYVMSGGSAFKNSYRYGYVEIGSGGSANTDQIGYAASMLVANGGKANNITLVSGGLLLVSSGGAALDVSWTPFVGRLSSAYGATVTYRSSYNGVYYGSGSSLLSHAMVLTPPVLSLRKSAYVMSGGTVNNTVVSSAGALFVHSGGIASKTTVNNYGSVYIYSGGRGNSLQINSGGVLYVDETGIAGNVNFASKAVTSVRHGGVIDSGNMNNAYISVDSGGVLKNISGAGYISCFDRGIVSNCIQSGGTTSVFNGGSAVNHTVTDGVVSVYSNGVASRAVISSGGRLLVSSAQAADVEIIKGGSCRINAGTLNRALVSGFLQVNLDGEVKNVTVCSGGSAQLNDNSIATNIDIVQGGSLYVGAGASASLAFTPWSGGNISSGGNVVITKMARDKKVYLGNNVEGVVSKCDTASNMAVSSGMSALIYSGGTANNTVVHSGSNSSGGRLYVSSGGKANYTTVNSGGYAYNVGGSMMGVTLKNGGRAYISKGSVADTLYISQGGNAYVWSGGTAKNAYTQSFGCLYVYDGGVASGTKLMTNGNLYIYSGGKAFDTVTSYGVKIHMYGGSMSKLNMQRGTIVSAYKGANVVSTTVDYGSYLMFGYSGNNCTGVASATNTTVLGGGGLTVITGAKATGITLAVNGTLTCNNNATIGGLITNAGRMNLAGSAGVAANTNIIFNLAGRSVSAMKESYREAMLNSYYVARNANMLITVSANQSAGSYILANWAGAAKGKFISLTVGSTKVGYLTIGNSITHNGKKYSLYNFDDATKSKALILTVQKINASAGELMDDPDTLPDLSMPELSANTCVSELSAENLCLDSCAPTIAAAPMLDDLFTKTTTQLPLLAV